MMQASIRMHELLPCCYVGGTAKQLRTEIQVSATGKVCLAHAAMQQLFHNANM